VTREGVRVPELPEVETLRRDVQRLLVGRCITAAELLVPDVLREPTPPAFVGALSGTAVVKAERRAKVLLVDLDDDQILALQLAIYGQLLLCPPNTPRKSETLLVLTLADGAEVHLRDGSRYTRVWLVPRGRLAAALRLDALGPEPLAPEFTVGVLRARLGGRRARLKALLLDQHVIAGLGNIYVDEALWRAHLHPARTASSLTDDETAALHGAIQSVLTEAIENRGTTFHTYRDLLGEKGHHQDALAVFHRQGKPCPRCGTPIQRITLASRDTHLCPTCQPEP
jgi:formamidopyrimidine-DNA glycosylase